MGIIPNYMAWTNFCRYEIMDGMASFEEEMEEKVNLYVERNDTLVRFKKIKK